MTAAPAAPCRLSVFLASEAPVGVVLRRGPSDWAQLTLWDRKTDQFSPGQWFHGRVYERRCDVSPNGALYVYFAAKHGRRADEDDVGDAWTAISRPPYFSALALWRNIGAWYGGGAFESDKTVLLDATCTLEPHPKFRSPKLKIKPMRAKTAPWEQRLLRDGWRLLERGFDPRTQRQVAAREIWQKPHPKRPVRLFREVLKPSIRRDGGINADAFWIEVGRELVPMDGATWADWDTWDRLAFVSDGRLHAASLKGINLVSEELYDFNPARPKQLAPPDWAKRWYSVAWGRFQGKIREIRRTRCATGRVICTRC